METVAIFVDVQNIYYTTRQGFGKQFDYRAFWSQATADRDVLVAYAYAIERNDGKQKAFQALVYLHRYNQGTLSRMRSEYVIPLQGKMTSRMSWPISALSRSTISDSNS